MEKAIKKAIEGGWRLKNQHIPKDGKYFVALIDGGITIKYQIEDKKGKPIDNDYANVADVLLDPAFWVAIGKAEGWKYPNGREKPYVEVWIEFIHHIAEGKDAESFFNELLK
jgi:hypothetical protein